MSYTHPTRPSRNVNAISSGQRNVNPDTKPPGAAENTPAQSRELQHKGGYAVKAPDPAKREKIQRVADAETKSYEHYKQNKKPEVNYVTTNAAVGGSSPQTGNTHSGLSGPSTRSRTKPSSLPSSSATRAPRLKPPSLRAQTNRLEDPEIERRKAEQRRKAEALKVKQAGRQVKLDEDRRNKNSQFLDRLEGKR